MVKYLIAINAMIDLVTNLTSSIRINNQKRPMTCTVHLSRTTVLKVLSMTASLASTSRWSRW